MGKTWCLRNKPNRLTLVYWAVCIWGAMAVVCGWIWCIRLYWGLLVNIQRGGNYHPFSLDLADAHFFAYVFNSMLALAELVWYLLLHLQVVQGQPVPRRLGFIGAMLAIHGVILCFCSSFPHIVQTAGPTIFYFAPYLLMYHDINNSDVPKSLHKGICTLGALIALYFLLLSFGSYRSALNCLAKYTGLGFSYYGCSPDKNILELASKRYADPELLTIAQQDGTMEELNEAHPIECLRKVGISYRAAYLGETSVAVILFDSSEKPIMGRVYSLNHTKADYDGFQIGQSLESVREFDPDGEYLFLYSGRNDFPRESTHYTKDGYVVVVEYDADNRIARVTENLI